MNEAVFNGYKADAKKNIKKAMGIVEELAKAEQPKGEIQTALVGSLTAGLFSISDALLLQAQVASNADQTGEAAELHNEMSNLVALIENDEADRDVLKNRANTITNMFGLHNVKSIDWESPFFAAAAQATEEQGGSARDVPEFDGGDTEYEDDDDPTRVRSA